MDPKVIRTEEQYYEYLNEVQRLMAEGGDLTREEGDQLELLTVLIESYENNKYPVEPPNPIDAILFRMHEKGLKQADLVPYFGTSSRVSEVLRGKRPLTVQMIRELSVGLGISTDTLLGISSQQVSPAKKEMDWEKFPVKEMMQRGWIKRITKSKSEQSAELVKNFIFEAGLKFGAASFRRTLHGEAESPTTRYALYAWLARVIQRTREQKKRLGKFDEINLSSGFLKELAQLSWSDQGPLLAVEFLEMNGIAVVIEKHLKGTQLDGAALKDIDGTPIVALTLRYDRLDNFWFTLLHEVAHLWKHVNHEDAFLDDFNAASEDRREAEANRLARDAFIPRTIWKRSDAYMSPSKETINSLAKDLKIHPSIIAGRLRKELGNYAMFPDLVGQNEVSEKLASLFAS